ncbi:hypothetical protein SAMN06265795_10214 [Noviherbaspirillum humi]|uniref:Uncharacterized protein n=2 Tax=Noviherbaspirillum humi TaxID=1688639 RepID=A0A239D7R6_9BURK|nr:hypothetical protein SAMN06265795_10214 [Noviherbaspirillum humi]
MTTSEMIESMIDATLGEEAGVREKHTMREALRGLVRLAKAEGLMENGLLESECLMNRLMAMAA